MIKFIVCLVAYLFFGVLLHTIMFDEDIIDDGGNMAICIFWPIVLLILIFACMIKLLQFLANRIVCDIKTLIRTIREEREEGRVG